MKYIKLFEKFDMGPDISTPYDPRVRKNIEDILVELKDDGLGINIYNTTYTQEFLDKYSSKLNFWYNGTDKTNLSKFIKEPCQIQTIYIMSADNLSRFTYKKEYGEIFEMLNEYIKEIYNLNDDDIFCIVNNTNIYYLKDCLNRNYLSTNKIGELRINYIIRKDTL